MNFKKKIKELIKSFFKVFGYKIYKLKTPTIVNKVLYRNDPVFTMQEAIKRCLSRGLKVNSVIDVGASDGRWSKACMESIPDANYLLIEAQLAHNEGLKKLKTENKNVEYVLAAAGKENGTIYFDNTDLFGGLASEFKLGENFVELLMVSLDSELKKRKLKPPYLLKLDTHGFEVPILEGAKKTIKEASLIIIETYNYKLTDDSLKYYEMCAYMEKLGFSSIEMVDFMQRKHDNSFWQMDTFFIPSDSKEFKYNSYI